MESGASAVGTSELRSTSLQPGRSWWAASVLRRRLPICIVARPGAMAWLLTALLVCSEPSKHRRRNLPRTPWDGLGVAESNRPPARKGGSILADQPMVFLPICAVGGLRCHSGVLLPGAESNRRPGACAQMPPGPDHICPADVPGVILE